jgi:hypothetical protein
MPRGKRVRKADDSPTLYRKFLPPLHVIYLNGACGFEMNASDVFAGSVGALNIVPSLSSSSQFWIR